MQQWRSSVDKTFWQKTWRLALPVSLQSMLFAVLGLVDVIMVSQLGEAQVAAVGIGNRIVFFNFLLIVGVSGAVGVLAAQYFGAGKMEGVRRTLLQSWVCAILLTLPFAVVYRVFPEQIVSLVSDDPSFVKHAHDYLYISGWTIVFVAIVVPLESALRAIGEAKMPTYVGLLAVVVNAVLNALLIFGLYGFPEMGLAGAALGTTISRAAQTAVLLVITYISYKKVLPKAEDIEPARTPKARKRYFTVAWPMIIHDGAWAMGVLVYSIIFAKLGVTELAIISLLSPIEGVLISAFFGFSVAAATILGHELGAENYQRAFHQSWSFLVISVSIAFIMGVSIWFSSGLVGEWLAKANTPNLDLSLNVTLVLALGMFLKVFNMVGIGGVLRSGGDIKYSIFIDIFGQWGIGIPLAILTGLVLGWPLHWVLISILAEEVVKVGLTTYRIYGRKWLKNLVNEDEEAIAA